MSNAISGEGSFDQDGSGTLILSGQTSLGGGTISAGTLQVTGAVTLTDAVINEATLRVVGAGVFTHAGRRILGNAAAVSAGEVLLSLHGTGNREHDLRL